MRILIAKDREEDREEDSREDCEEDSVGVRRSVRRSEEECKEEWEVEWEEEWEVEWEEEWEDRLRLVPYGDLGPHMVQVGPPILPPPPQPHLHQYVHYNIVQNPGSILLSLTTTIFYFL